MSEDQDDYSGEDSPSSYESPDIYSVGNVSDIQEMIANIQYELEREKDEERIKELIARKIELEEQMEGGRHVSPNFERLRQIMDELRNIDYDNPDRMELMEDLEGMRNLIAEKVDIENKIMLQEVENKLERMRLKPNKKGNLQDDLRDFAAKADEFNRMYPRVDVQQPPMPERKRRRDSPDQPARRPAPPERRPVPPARSPQRSIKKTAPVRRVVQIPVDANEYLVHKRVVLVKKDSDGFTYPVPITSINGIPCYALSQLDHLYNLYNMNILSDYLTDVIPVYEENSDKIINFKGNPPWYIYEYVSPSTTSRFGQFSKYYAEQEFRNKFGHSFIVRRGVAKVLFINRNSCNELPQELCIGGCKWNNEFCETVWQNKNVWKQRKNDTKLQGMVKSALRNIGDILKFVPINSAMYQQVKNYHEIRIRKHLQNKLGPIKEKKVPKPPRDVPGEKYAEDFVTITKWNGIPLEDRTNEFIQRGILKVDADAMDIIQNPTKYFPNYRKNKFVLENGIKEIPQLQLDIVSILKNMHFTYVLTTNIPKEAIRRICGNIYDVLDSVLNNNFKLMEPVVIKPRDVVEYMGDSYCQFVEYRYGVVEDKYGNKKYLYDGCIYQPNQNPDYVFNDSYYVVANRLWGGTSISTNAARRLGLLLGIDISGIPPCFSAKPHKRKERKGAVIDGDDVNEYFVRDHRQFSVIDYEDRDFGNAADRENMGKYIEGVRNAYKNALIDGKRLYEHYQFDLIRAQETLKRTSATIEETEDAKQTIETYNKQMEELLKPIKSAYNRRVYLGKKYKFVMPKEFPFHLGNYFQMIFANYTSMSEDRRELFLEEFHPPSYINTNKIFERTILFDALRRHWGITEKDWLNLSKRQIIVRIR